MLNTNGSLCGPSLNIGHRCTPTHGQLCLSNSTTWACGTSGASFGSGNSWGSNSTCAFLLRRSLSATKLPFHPMFCCVAWPRGRAMAASCARIHTSMPCPRHDQTFRGYASLNLSKVPSIRQAPHCEMNPIFNPIHSLVDVVRSVQ